MQTAVPDVIRFTGESEETKRLYGLDNEITRPFGEVCLAARRLSEGGRSAKERRPVVDSAAAAILLQAWLDGGRVDEEPAR